MKTRKFLGLLLVFVMLFVALAACGDDKEKKEATPTVPAATEEAAPAATEAAAPAATEAAAPAATEAAGGEVKTVRVALILPGRKDDVSWNQASFDGMNSAVESLEGTVSVDLTVVEQVYDPVDIEPALRDYAQQGYDLVVGHGFQFQEPIIKVAAEYPDVNFAIGTGYKLADNVGVYDVKLEQGGYLMGIMAASLSTAGKIGVVGGVDVSEIHRGHVAFKLGAESVNKDITVLQGFVGDFNDLAGAKEAALNQISAGADVLWQSGDGVGIAVLGACQEKNIICMGNVANQSSLAPENTLASFVYDWSPLYVQFIQETADGTYGNKQVFIEFANGGVSIVYNDALKDKITPEIQTKLDDAEKGLTDGTLDLGDLDSMKLE
jgi:basic membrane protein A